MLLQIYLSFYLIISSMADQVSNSNVFDDALFLYSLKVNFFFYFIVENMLWQFL